MANKYFTQLTQLTSGNVASGDALAIEDVSAGETKYISASDLQAYMSGGGTYATKMSGRLTTESGVPNSQSDRSAQSTVYLTPYNGNHLAIYDGSADVTKSFSELTLTLNASAHLSGNVYDVYVFLSGGVVTLGTSPAWTSTSARGTGAGTAEYELYNGYYRNKNTMTMKNGASTYSNITARYATLVGTIYCSANAQTDDTLAKRYVWNYNNRLPRRMFTGKNASHTYTTGTVRAWNSNTTIGEARMACVIGVADAAMGVRALSVYTSATSGLNYLYIGLNTTTTPSENSSDAHSLVGVGGGAIMTASHSVILQPVIGYNYIQALEYGFITSNTITDIIMSGILQC